MWKYCTDVAGVVCQHVKAFPSSSSQIVKALFAGFINSGANTKQWGCCGIYAGRPSGAEERKLWFALVCEHWPRVWR